MGDTRRGANDYVQRINRAIDYLTEHLPEAPSLDVLAAEACFSPYHFHRIFKALVGETVHDYSRRVRLARAALKLRSSPRVRATDVALEYGFASLSDLSRAFKAAYGTTIRRWDRDAPLQNRKNWQVLADLPRYTPDQLGAAAHREFAVAIRHFPELRLAYVRVTDAYSGTRVLDALHRLRAWAREQVGPEPLTTIGMSEDDPDITPVERCRYDIAVVVGSEVQGSGEVSVRTLPPRPMAVVRATGSIEVIDRAWQFLFRYWLPRSRYQPADAPAMEIFLDPEKATEWQTFDLECCVPLEPL